MLCNSLWIATFLFLVNMKQEMSRIISFFSAFCGEMLLYIVFFIYWDYPLSDSLSVSLAADA